MNGALLFHQFWFISFFAGSGWCPLPYGVITLWQCSFNLGLEPQDDSLFSPSGPVSRFPCEVVDFVSSVFGFGQLVLQTVLVLQALPSSVFVRPVRCWVAHLSVGLLLNILTIIIWLPEDLSWRECKQDFCTHQKILFLKSIEGHRSHPSVFYSNFVLGTKVKHPGSKRGIFSVCPCPILLLVAA